MVAINSSSNGKPKSAADGVPITLSVGVLSFHLITDDSAISVVVLLHGDPVMNLRLAQGAYPSATIHASADTRLMLGFTVNGTPAVMAFDEHDRLIGVKEISEFDPPLAGSVDG